MMDKYEPPKRVELHEPSPAFQGVMMGVLFGIILFAPAIIRMLGGE